MANILDLFRTHTGDRLLNRSIEITNLNKEEIHSSFLIILPSLLAIMKTRKSIENKISINVIKFIQEADLISEGKKVTEKIIAQAQIDNLKKCSVIPGISEEKFKDFIDISTGILSVIISQILKDNNHLGFTDVIRTLTGEETKADKAFIQALVKNSDNPDFIDSSEEISFNTKKDDNDESILGGYTGGK